MQVEYDAGTQLYGFSDWELEKMGARRVMGDSVLLPNGNVIILNGAQVGLVVIGGPAIDGCLPACLDATTAHAACFAGKNQACRSPR